MRDPYRLHYWRHMAPYHEDFPTLTEALQWAAAGIERGAMSPDRIENRRGSGRIVMGQEGIYWAAERLYDEDGNLLVR